MSEDLVLLLPLDTWPRRSEAPQLPHQLRPLLKLLLALLMQAELCRLLLGPKLALRV